MKTEFTVREAAELCKVSQQTIIRSLDLGHFQGVHVLGTRSRCIPRDALYRFMEENDMPTDALEIGIEQSAEQGDRPARVDKSIRGGDAWEILERMTGTVDAPPDWSEEHDHYLYGIPKQDRETDRA